MSGRSRYAQHRELEPDQFDDLNSGFVQELFAEYEEANPGIEIVAEPQLTITAFRYRDDASTRALLVGWLSSARISSDAQRPPTMTSWCPPAL